MRSPLLFLLPVLMVVSSCSPPVATPYKSKSSGGPAGGYEEHQTSNGLWHVMFAGNGMTDSETMQTYWLYHCAELALSQGYDGFEIVSKMKLSSRSNEMRGVQVAANVPVAVWVPMAPAIPMSADGTFFHTIGDIRLVKKPYDFSPPKSFDAIALKSALEPQVTGKKCEYGNVCPRIHDYLSARHQ